MNKIFIKIHACVLVVIVTLINFLHFLILFSNDRLYDWVLLNGLETYKAHHSEIVDAKDKEVPYDAPRISTEKRKLIAHLDAGMKKLENHSKMLQQRERERALASKSNAKESAVPVNKQRTEAEIPAVQEQTELTREETRQLSVPKMFVFDYINSIFSPLCFLQKF